MPKRRTTIQRKLMVSLMVTSGVVVLLASSVFITYDAVSARRVLARKLRTRAEMYATNLTASLEFRIHTLVALLIMGSSTLVALALSASLQKRISQPILALAGTARTVAERKDYTMRAAKLSDDELGFLTECFNDMLSEIQERDGS